MASSLAWFAGSYIAAFMAWASVFRRWIDPWLRRRIGALMGVEIVWVEALRFPLRARIWGTRHAADERVETRVGFVAAGALFGAAMVPIVALSALLASTARVPEDVGHALYLMSTVLLVVFLRSVSGSASEAA